MTKKCIKKKLRKKCLNPGVIFGPFGVILGHLGSYLGHFGPFWFIFGHFWAIWTNLRKVQIFCGILDAQILAFRMYATRVPPSPSASDEVHKPPGVGNRLELFPKSGGFKDPTWFKTD